MSGETASLIIALKSIGADAVRRELSDTATFAAKSAKESAAVFTQAYKDRNAAALHWHNVETDRLRDVNIVRQRDLDAFKAQEAQKQEVLRKTAALAKETAMGQRDAQVVAYNKAMSLRDTGMGPRDSHVDVWKAIQAEKVAAAKAAAVAERRELAATRVAEAKAAAERKQEAREVERARIAAAREAARQERASAASSSKGFKVGIGAIAGQGFSVGGIAQVSPLAAGGFAAAYAAKNITQDLVREATVWEKFKVALTDIEGSAAKAKDTTNDLYELAKRPGIGLKEAEQTYIQFRALSMEGEKAQKVIKAVSNAVALSGGGAVEFQRVNYQITQMLSKGKVLEEDLRIMRNSLPRLTVAMREAFGTTTAEGIRKAGVNAEQFLDKIVTQFEKLPTASQTLESTLENAATAQSRFKASLVNTDYVKDQLAGWTGLLESMTKVVEGETIKWGQLLGDVFTQGPWSARNNFAAGAYNETPEQALSNEIDKKIKRLESLKNMSSFAYALEGNQGTSKDEEIANLKEEIGKYSVDSRMAAVNKYIANLGPVKSSADDKAAILEADKAILLENQKLGIALSNNNAYEKARLTLAAEYAYKIGEAKTEEDKIALANQRGLQLSILAQKHKEEEAKALAKINQEIDAQRIAALEVSEYEKKRLEIGVKYELLMREAANAEQQRALATAKALELEANLRQKNLDIAASWKAIENEGSSGEGATGEKRKGAIKKIEDLSYNYASDQEKMFLDRERAQEEILVATERYGQRRNELLEQADREYAVKNAQFWADIGSNMATSASSMFGDFASVAKSSVEATYQKERSIVMANTQLTSNQREVMLKQADARREKELGGTYARMFKVSKAFAIADSLVQILNAQAKSANLPYPANLAAMATTLAATGSIVANLSAIKYSGAYAKGGDIPAGSFGIAGEIGPEIVMGPAHVTSTADSARILGNKGETKVVVNNYAGADVSANELPDGTLEIVIAAAAEAAENRLASNLANGRGTFTQTLERTYGVRRGR